MKISNSQLASKSSLGELPPEEYARLIGKKSPLLLAASRTAHTPMADRVGARNIAYNLIGEILHWFSHLKIEYSGCVLDSQKLVERVQEVLPSLDPSTIVSALQSASIVMQLTPPSTGSREGLCLKKQHGVDCEVNARRLKWILQTAGGQGLTSASGDGQIPFPKYFPVAV